MGFKQLDLKLPTDFTADTLREQIARKLRLKEHQFSFTIERQGLDARKKDHIHWSIRVGVHAARLTGPPPPPGETLDITYKKRHKKVVIIGNGPAGFFAGHVLLAAGFDVVLVEQGPQAPKRATDIARFERTGNLDEHSNYAFGEGGAGTFSDGKLTSRTKSISKERRYVFDTYISAGAPPEIAWMTHPHLGSDNLVKIIVKLRNQFLENGGTILFNTTVQDFTTNGKGRVLEVTATDTIRGDYFIFATGHSAYPTYRMLIKKGVPFDVKGFALGCRVEHRQEIINRAQWGCPALPGVKAAEYRLTRKGDGHLPVYSFCMCPGGKVVPAAPYSNLNIVNGMSNYRRNSPFANAAVVVGIHPEQLLKHPPTPLTALDRLQELEEAFFRFSGGHAAPACKIKDFLLDRVSGSFEETSYPLGLVPADFNTLLPADVTGALKAGMNQFARQLRGFEGGIMLGLESKTSSPIRAPRESNRRSPAFENLYIAGEGSGCAGGIVSSAADGIKTAMHIADHH